MNYVSIFMFFYKKLDGLKKVTLKRSKMRVYMSPCSLSVNAYADAKIITAAKISITTILMCMGIADVPSVA